MGEGVLPSTYPGDVLGVNFEAQNFFPRFAPGKKKDQNGQNPASVPISVKETVRAESRANKLIKKQAMVSEKKPSPVVNICFCQLQIYQRRH